MTVSNNYSVKLRKIVFTSGIKNIYTIFLFYIGYILAAKVLLPILIQKNNSILPFSHPQRFLSRSKLQATCKRRTTISGGVNICQPQGTLDHGASKYNSSLYLLGEYCWGLHYFTIPSMRSSSCYSQYQKWLYSCEVRSGPDLYQWLSKYNPTCSRDVAKSTCSPTQAETHPYSTHFRY